LRLHDVLLALHIGAGIAGLALGAAVIYSSRESPILDRRSATYPWTVFAVSLTAAGLLALDWPELWWIATLAALAYGLALLAYLAPRLRFRGWTLAYAHGQGGSYIALVPALIVVALTVDGPVHGAAAVAVWVLPTLVGTRLIQRWHRRLVEGCSRTQLGMRVGGGLGDGDRRRDVPRVDGEEGDPFEPSDASSQR
jgi:hypothetical protein